MPRNTGDPAMIDDDDADDTFEVKPSELDELTHAEMQVLYGTSEENIRFAKGIQWCTVVWTFAVFVLLVLACYFLNRDELFVKTAIVVSFAFSAGAIYALSIFQSWQGTEREKIRVIIGRFSNVATEIHRIKSQMEANIHRYILFTFMVISMLIANYLLVVMLMKLYAR
jgi:hypothetical protein